MNRAVSRRPSGSEERRVPAIVVGRGHTALGALRCLVLAGVPAYVACPQGDMATHSRWYRPTPGPLPWDGMIGPRANAALQAMPLERAVLLPGTDDAALWMADLAQDPLAQRFPASVSSRATLEVLQDKSRFAAWLRDTGIPHPRTFLVDSRDDIAAIPFAELDRVFVKPTDSQQFSQDTGIKGVWANGRREFEDVWTRLDAQGFKVVAQEYVPGSSADHFFIDGFRDREGNFGGLFARRRLRIHPPDFGNSSYCRSVPLTDVRGAGDHLFDLLSRLSYRGIFSAEFKRDARDGQFRLLEVNTRAWWYVEFAARCGVNVCAMACQDALGQPVRQAQRRYPVGAGCVNLEGDLKAVFSQRPLHSIPMPRMFAQWARAHFHVFRWDDPIPAIAVTWRRLWRLTAAMPLRLRLRRAASTPG